MARPKRKMTSPTSQDGGGGIEAYRWVYGPAFREEPFLPHRNLDGVVFENFDDFVLTNPGGFPETPFYYPGDHVGCGCDFEPIVLSPDEMATAQNAQHALVAAIAAKVAGKQPMEDAARAAVGHNAEAGRHWWKRSH